MFHAQYPGVPVLWVDAGELAGDTSRAGRFQTETLLEGMGRLGYAAANVTERELAYGVDAFREIASKAAFPLLSGNIVFQSDDAPVFPATTVKTFAPGAWRGDAPLRVGILGLTHEHRGLVIRIAD